MAVFLTNVWKFTNADVSVNPVTVMRLRINSVRWVGATNASHGVLLKDLNGNVVCEMASNSTDYSEEKAIPLPCDTDANGLVVAQLDSGTLYVEIA